MPTPRTPATQKRKSEAAAAAAAAALPTPALTPVAPADTAAMSDAEAARAAQQAAAMAAAAAVMHEAAAGAVHAAHTGEEAGAATGLSVPTDGASQEEMVAAEAAAREARMQAILRALAVLASNSGAPRAPRFPALGPPAARCPEGRVVFVKDHHTPAPL